VTLPFRALALGLLWALSAPSLYKPLPSRGITFMDASDALVDVTTVDGPDMNMNGAPDGLRAFVGAGGPEADDGEPSLETLEAELPVVHDEQVPLGDLVSRVVQALYAELSELAETCVIAPCTRCCFLIFLRLFLPSPANMQRAMLYT
jgi:hypothetical protein